MVRLDEKDGAPVVVVVVFDPENGLDVVEFVEGQALTAAKPAASQSNCFITAGPSGQGAAVRHVYLMCCKIEVSLYTYTQRSVRAIAVKYSIHSEVERHRNRWASPRTPRRERNAIMCSTLPILDS
jgi:hypothetical protein